jgi:hypothetical protein
MTLGRLALGVSAGLDRGTTGKAPLWLPGASRAAKMVFNRHSFVDFMGGRIEGMHEIPFHDMPTALIPTQPMSIGRGVDRRCIVFRFARVAMAPCP